MPINLSPQERFFKKVNKTDSCWLWTGALSSRGYGSFRVDGKTISTHRLSYSWFKGEVPEGIFVCHTCDIPACVNPDHLWLGTNSDNMQDMIAKDRHGRSMRTQTHCRKGHDFAVFGFKTFTRKNGKVEKYCKECKKISDSSRVGKNLEYMREYHRKNRDKLNEQKRLQYHARKNEKQGLQQ
jgi:hypothetical protein